MEIVHGHTLSYEPVSLSHRGTGLGFKWLSVGTENTPENYLLVLGKQKDFYSPVHRHNFDQFRYAYQGDFNLTPSLNLKEGQLSYHPEGVQYGPQDDGPEERILLVLQCGGASGQGFLSHPQMRKANQELAERGKFLKGKYYADTNGATNGEAKGIDGYQAIWEHVNGRPLKYPKGRYHTPVLMDPDNFSWTKVKSGTANGGVFKKTLGVFSERELRVEALKIDETGGSITVGGDDAIHLVFVLSGNGIVEDQELQREGTIRLDPGTAATIRSDSGTEMLHYVMPTLA